MLALLPTGTAPDLLFLCLFLRRLPASMRDHLAAADHKTTAAMAAHADRPPLGFQGRPVSCINCRVCCRRLPPWPLTHAAPLAEPPPRQQEPPAAQPMPRRRPDSRSRNEDPSLCFYHNRFKNKATKCESPCTWSKN
jgi:hypothetical protein